MYIIAQSTESVLHVTISGLKRFFSLLLLLDCEGLFATMSGHLHQSDALPEIESKTNMTRVRHIEEASRYLKDEDPHRAALEDNPEHAPELTWSTCFAVLVCFSLFPESAFLRLTLRAYDNSSWH